jgi:hypothetical protein
VNLFSILSRTLFVLVPVATLVGCAADASSEDESGDDQETEGLSSTTSCPGSPTLSRDGQILSHPGQGHYCGLWGVRVIGCNTGLNVARSHLAGKPIHGADIRSWTCIGDAAYSGFARCEQKRSDGKVRVVEINCGA